MATPLAMSVTKEDLLTHLELDSETYILMAKEADQAYRSLTSEKRHLKENCKRKPPYDWSDIVEKSKDEAMCAIAQNGSERTSYYWNLATPTNDCPNWIARWFLYHKFRYRDGRNRNAGKAEAGSSRHRHSHHHHSSHRRSSYVAAAEQSSYSPGSYYYSGTSASSAVNVGRNNSKRIYIQWQWLLLQKSQLANDTQLQPNEPRCSATVD
ncbi:sigma-70 region 2 protein [Rutstroemia sp. NJR-2017a WRK4]|nr:sigma-70 region 2 protein [Rutstroemia sp. NJR-2017a WRK4]